MEQKLSQQEKRKIALLRTISFAVTASFLMLLVLSTVIWSGLQELQGMTAEVERMTADLSAVTAELALVDWDVLADTVEEAVLSASSGLESAVETLETLDMSSLNAAVEELSEAVGPISDFAKRIE